MNMSGIISAQREAFKREFEKRLPKPACGCRVVLDYEFVNELAPRCVYVRTIEPCETHRDELDKLTGDQRTQLAVRIIGEDLQQQINRNLESIFRHDEVTDFSKFEMPPLPPTPALLKPGQ